MNLKKTIGMFALLLVLGSIFLLLGEGGEAPTQQQVNLTIDGRIGDMTIRDNTMEEIVYQQVSKTNTSTLYLNPGTYKVDYYCTYPNSSLWKNLYFSTVASNTVLNQSINC